MNENDSSSIIPTTEATGHAENKKRVTFPKAKEALTCIVCEIPNREDLTSEDHAALWFSRYDYLTIKFDARRLSSESERTGSSKILNNAFQDKSKDVQSILDRWVLESSEQRGLERMANTEHGNLRQQEQFKVTMDVLRAQDDMLVARRKLDHDEMRKISNRASRTARHFARMIAKADATALGTDLGTSDHDRRESKTTHSHHHHSKKGNKSPSKDKENFKTETADGDHSKPKRTDMIKQAYKDTKQKYQNTKAGIIARIPRIA